MPINAKPIPQLSDKDIARYHGHVDRSAGPEACWPYQGATDNRGYCFTKIGGRKGQRVATHRLAVHLSSGTFPVEWDVDHLCKNRICNNPKHLEPVPHEVNVQRGDLMGNTWAKGEDHGRAILTEELVREIRKLYATGAYTQKQLGQQFNVTATTIGHVVNRFTWAHLPE